MREKGIPQPPAELDGPCGDAEVAGDVAIGSPVIGQRVKGGVPITGNARGGGLPRLQAGGRVRGDARTSGSRSAPEHGDQVSNGQLEFWDTTGFDGLYTLRLVVMREQRRRADQRHAGRGGQHAARGRRSSIPQNDQTYVMEDDELVSITADAQDTWEMDRVEFYLDGTKLGESTVAPYSLRWTITMSDVVPAFGAAGHEPRG